MLVMTLKYPTERIEIHMLNPGENFPLFGGSRHGLTVRKTASLITRRISPNTISDMEHDITDPHVWGHVIGLINATNGEVTAIPPGTPETPETNEVKS